MYHVSSDIFYFLVKTSDYPSTVTRKYYTHSSLLVSLVISCLFMIPSPDPSWFVQESNQVVIWFLSFLLLLLTSEVSVSTVCCKRRKLKREKKESVIQSIIHLQLCSIKFISDFSSSLTLIIIISSSCSPSSSNQLPHTDIYCLIFWLLLPEEILLSRKQENIGWLQEAMFSCICWQQSDLSFLLDPWPCFSSSLTSFPRKYSR